MQRTGWSDRVEQAFMPAVKLPEENRLQPLREYSGMKNDLAFSAVPTLSLRRGREPLPPIKFPKGCQ